jgi:hypothetical protein
MNTFALVASTLSAKRHSSLSHRTRIQSEPASPPPRRSSSELIRHTTQESKKAPEISALNYLCDIDENPCLREYITHQTHISYLLAEQNLCRALLENARSGAENSENIESAKKDYQNALTKNLEQVHTDVANIIHAHQFVDRESPSGKTWGTQKFKLLKKTLEYAYTIRTTHANSDDTIAKRNEEQLINSLPSIENEINKHQALARNAYLLYTQDKKALSLSMASLDHSNLGFAYNLELNPSLKRLLQVKIECYILSEEKILHKKQNSPKIEELRKRSQEKFNRYTEKLKKDFQRETLQTPSKGTWQRESLYRQFCDHVNRLKIKYAPRLQQAIEITHKDRGYTSRLKKEKSELEGKSKQYKKELFKQASKKHELSKKNLTPKPKQVAFQNPFRVSRTLSNFFFKPFKTLTFSKRKFVEASSGKTY